MRALPPSQTPKDHGHTYVTEALRTSPCAAISLEWRKVSALSALAGIPGGLAMFGTIPADLVQYLAHALRIEQKLAYAYGWESFLDEEDEVDDETMCRLIVFQGIVMQVGSANVAQELRALKGLLDDGIISQEDFDAKKRELLGL